MKAVIFNRANARSAGVLCTLAVLTVAMLMLVPSGAGSMAVGGAELAVPELKVHLGISGGAAVGIWNAFMSPWGMALSLALVPLGFGAWAVTIRLTFAALVKQLGKEAARKAALTF